MKHLNTKLHGYFLATLAPTLETMKAKCSACQTLAELAEVKCFLNSVLSTNLGENSIYHNEYALLNRWSGRKVSSGNTPKRWAKLVSARRSLAAFKGFVDAAEDLAYLRYRKLKKLAAQARKDARVVYANDLPARRRQVLASYAVAIEPTVYYRVVGGSHPTLPGCGAAVPMGGNVVGFCTPSLEAANRLVECIDEDGEYMGFCGGAHVMTVQVTKVIPVEFLDKNMKTDHMAWLDDYEVFCFEGVRLG